MSRPILLHIARDTEGRWRVSVGDGATRPAAGVLGADAVAGSFWAKARARRSR